MVTTSTAGQALSEAEILRLKMDRQIHHYNNSTASCTCIACASYVPEIAFPPEPRRNRAERRRIARLTKKRR